MKEKIIILLKNDIFNKLIKYGLVTIINYCLLIFGTFSLVNYLKITEDIAYLIIISLIYIITFFINTRFVFSVKFSKTRLKKYIISLLIMWALNNLVFNLLTKILEIKYIFAILINIFSLGFIRFFIQYYFVFNKNDQ